MKRWLALLAFVSGCACAADVKDAEAVPHLGAAGVSSYREFLAAGRHRAFAIAPGGAWAWRSDMPSRDIAVELALDDCGENTQQTCVLYAADDRVVFDAAAWRKLWGPYATAAGAQRAATGVRRGERFPDLVFRDAAGRTAKVSDARGKVLVLHFWGSWCGPCRRELPDLERLVGRMGKRRDVRFVFLPVREPFAVASAWAAAQQLRLPLFDGGEKEFTLADGSKLADRQVAGKFPTTYVLDKRGVVVFSHVGEAARWMEYAPFIEDAALRSGQ